MGKSRRPASSPPPAAGGAWRPSWGYLVVAAVLAVGGLGALLLATNSDEDALYAAASAPPTPVVQPSERARSIWSIQATVPVFVDRSMASNDLPLVEGDNDPTPDLSSYVARGAKPSMNEVIDRLHAAGVHTGLGAFNPPGTRPNLVGLAVPADFVLPEGYVRHHQATDDGQPVEAILMYAPDRQFFDANKRPIEIPKDRVVTKEFAPPGLPIRLIAIPPPTDSGRSGL